MTPRPNINTCDALRDFVASIKVDGQYSSMIQQLGVFVLSICETIETMDETLEDVDETLGDIHNINSQLSSLEENINLLLQKQNPNIEPESLESTVEKTLKNKKLESYEMFYNNWVRPAGFIVVGYLLDKLLKLMFP